MHIRGHGERARDRKRREGGAAGQEIDCETVLLDWTTHVISGYLGFNAAGTLMWRALAAGTICGELTAQLQRDFARAEVSATDVELRAGGHDGDRYDELVGDRTLSGLACP